MATEPMMMCSENGAIGLGAGLDVLRAGGSVLDALEAAALPVEQNLLDHTVGVGGVPNMLQRVQLDAGIMDGATLSVGAVAAMEGFLEPVRVARKVMERLPHSLLAGAGAERFAAEQGFERVDHLTEEAVARWKQRLVDRGIWPLPEDRLTDSCRTALRSERWGGTVNFLARDAAGNLAVCVSTSGIGWKYPGRVGDSPLAGSGFYADNLYGAASCTGRGELSMQGGTALRTIMGLERGLSPEDAGAEAMRFLARVRDGWGGGMNLLVLDRQGRHAGFSSVSGRKYALQTLSMTSHVLLDRIHVDIGQEDEG
jgi:beta-aspartyl-peptidase (threonine type)